MSDQGTTEHNAGRMPVAQIGVMEIADDLESLITDTRIAAEVIWHIASNIGLDNVPAPRVSDADANTLMSSITTLRVSVRALEEKFQGNWVALVGRDAQFLAASAAR